MSWILSSIFHAFNILKSVYPYEAAFGVMKQGLLCLCGFSWFPGVPCVKQSFLVLFPVWSLGSVYDLNSVIQYKSQVNKHSGRWDILSLFPLGLVQTVTVPTYLHDTEARVCRKTVPRASLNPSTIEAALLHYICASSNFALSLSIS